MQAGEIASVIFWLSLASTTVAALGIWRRWQSVLLLTAVLSAPYALIVFGYPPTRYYIFEPAFHIVAALTLQGTFRWVSWIMLLLILGLAGWFVFLRFAP